MPEKSAVPSFPSFARLKPQSASRIRFLFASVLACFLMLPVCAQQGVPEAPPVVVRPGAPGQPTKVLATDTRATLPPRSAKNVEFMQGMIMHHAQAVEMTALIGSRSVTKNIRLLGARISASQLDEMVFMKRWLEARGEPVEMAMSKPGTASAHSHGSHSSHSASHQMVMPGMLSAKQMDALKNAKGSEFEKLFLTGMIQHHNGALVMVNDLFETAGAGQDAELFNFTTDVDTSQQAEINIMRNMLGEKPVKEKL